MARLIRPRLAAAGALSRLSKLAIQALRRHPQTAEWVFASAAGTPIGICNFHKNSWRPLLKRAGLPHTQVHNLRHTAATLMLARGVQVKVVSEMLGHADVSTTLSIYAHVLPDMQGGAASAVNVSNIVGLVLLFRERPS
jgi:integrase